MPEVEMKVQNDLVERLTHAKAPMALAELIWNGFDAEAPTVTVEYDTGALGRVEEIRVIDRGHGMTHSEAVELYENLGGSWKRTAPNRMSKNNLVRLHGEKGQGRLKAFALGDNVEWTSVAVLEDGSKQRTVIRTDRNSIRKSLIEDPPAPEPVNAQTGTVVRVFNTTPKAFALSDPEKLALKLAAMFAPHLRQNPQLALYLGGDRVDPAAMIEHEATYVLEVAEYPDESIELDVIEWRIPFERALHLCDERGMSIDDIKPEIVAPSFNFTAYVRWAGFRAREELLGLAEMNDEIRPVIDEARRRLTEHFHARYDARDTRVIESWRDEGTYPYEVETDDPVIVAERQVFDLVALTLNAANPQFSKTDQITRRATLRLLREAVERSPQSILKILESVAKLDKDRMDELAVLLDRTTLPQIITAAHATTHRITFLHALEKLLFEFTNDVGERDHLHKILDRELWIFGDNYEHAISERGLTNVLRQHIKILGRDDLVSEPVRLPDGSLGRVDLMVSAVNPGRGRSVAEHLVVELKAPHVEIGTEEIAQIEKYANTLLDHPQFQGIETTWEFWLVGNTIHPSSRRRVEPNDRPRGLIDFGDNYRIWVFQWSMIIDDCRRRLQHFADLLELQTTDGDAMQQLRTIHGQRIPEILRNGEDADGAPGRMGPDE